MEKYEIRLSKERKFREYNVLPMYLRARIFQNLKNKSSKICKEAVLQTFLKNIEQKKKFTIEIQGEILGNIDVIIDQK